MGMPGESYRPRSSAKSGSCMTRRGCVPWADSNPPLEQRAGSSRLPRLHCHLLPCLRKKHRLQIRRCLTRIRTTPRPLGFDSNRPPRQSMSKTACCSFCNLPLMACSKGGSFRFPLHLSLTNWKESLSLYLVRLPFWRTRWVWEKPVRQFSLYACSFIKEWCDEHWSFVPNPSCIIGCEN